MLSITIPEGEMWDEQNNEFVHTNRQSLKLEHSLVSISKWESRWHKPFLETQEKTTEEVIDYVRCMTITQNVNPNVYYFLTQANIEAINQYISDPMTATTFSGNKKQNNRERVTSELIYYWMVTFNIPFECQKWHLNRLITLINVCGVKNQPPKKMSQRELMTRNAAINAARKKKYNTHG